MKTKIAIIMIEKSHPTIRRMANSYARSRGIGKCTAIRLDGQENVRPWKKVWWRNGHIDYTSLIAEFRLGDVIKYVETQLPKEFGSFLKELADLLLLEAGGQDE